MKNTRTLNRLRSVTLFALLVMLFGCANNYGSKLFIDSARNGDVARIKELTQLDPFIMPGRGDYERDKVEALLEAARNGHTEVVSLLITVYSYNGQAATAALEAAINNNQTGVVRVLLKAGAEPGDRNAALQIAQAKGNDELVRLLKKPEAIVVAKSNVRSNVATAPAAEIMDIKEFRQKYPQYNDLSDTDIAEKFHDKYYSDIPYDIFAQKFGVSGQPAQSEDIQDVPSFNAPARQNDVAVVIGIEEYRGLPRSDFSRSDAGLVKDYLRAMGFQERNIALLTDSSATLSDIKKTVEGWLPNRARKDSAVFIYYSGHGAPDVQSGEAYMVPFEGDPNYLEDTGYPLKRLYERIAKLEAREVVVVLDSCFSGSGGRSVLAKGARPLVMMTDKTVLPPNVAVISSTQGSQISTSSPEKGHGVFTYYFLKAIKDGKKDLKEIYGYLKPLVEDEARTLNVQQSPSLNPAPETMKRAFVLIK